jgi:transcription antitermination factor NusG
MFQYMPAFTIPKTMCSFAPPLLASHPEERWFAVYTRANHEKRVATQLEARGIRHFLPLYSSLRRWQDRHVRLEMPLFPGYIFVHFAPSARLCTLEVPGVVRLIGFNGQPYPLPTSEIEALRAGIMSAVRIEPHRLLNAGCRVRIKSGPLAGMEGILVRKKNVHRVVLTISAIARSASVEVDILEIERIA